MGACRERKGLIGGARRLIVKVGSSVLIDASKRLRIQSFRELAKQIRNLHNHHMEAILVSSGAIAAGMSKLHLLRRPHAISQKQALAAIGQSRLMQLYEQAFERQGQKVAQVLLTHDDLANRKRFLNARNAIHSLLNYGVLPIINENDTVAVNEIQFGDNDRLAALVTHLLEADLLILLTNVDGLIDPGTSKTISVVEQIDLSIKKSIRNDKSPFGLGGMKAKIEAAEMATSYGVPTIVANGRTPHILERLIKGEDLGTLFLPRPKKLNARKHWIAYTLRAKGSVVIDSGAKRAIAEKGKSLLPSGIVDVQGSFGRGEMIEILDEKSSTIAKGLTTYSSTELQKIQGKKSSEIEAILGYKYGEEVIHRDNLVLSTEIQKS